VPRDQYKDAGGHKANRNNRSKAEASFVICIDLLDMVEASLQRQCARRERCNQRRQRLPEIVAFVSHYFFKLLIVAGIVRQIVMGKENKI